MKTKLMAMLLAAGAALGAWADTETVGAYTWTYRIVGDTAEIEGRYNSSTYSYDPAVSPNPTGAVTIPSMLGGKPVVRIGDHSFYECGGLTSVTIPDSVTSIGYRAFDSTGLTGVTIPSSVKSIGNWVFSFCQSLTSVTIPEGVESIGGWAFAHSDYLVSVSIPSTVTRFDEAVFYDCDSLANVTLQDGLKSIGKRMFDACPSLTSLTIPASVTTIGDEAFRACTGLASVTIPANVTSIEPATFKECASLANVTMLGNVTDIGDEAFMDCASLASITLPDCLTSIGRMAFYNCASLAGIAIPAGVENIGDGAFKGCVLLADGDGFVIVRNFLYDYTGTGTSVAIPDGIVGIGLETFKDCASLTGVTIPGSVARIGLDAFKNCDSLVFDTATIPGVKLLCGWAVGYNSSMPADLDLAGICGIGDGAFYGCTALKSVAIPDGITRIGDATFYLCSSLAGVTIPDSVTSIGREAFVGCASLADVTIPASVKDIGYLAFIYSALTNVTIQEGVENIGIGAFAICPSLASVTIPSSVAHIGAEAFTSCNSLANVTIQEGVKSIGIQAFYGCPSLASVTIPSSVVQIGDMAFGGCASLANVTIQEGVKSIGYGAFGDCTSLIGLTIPASIASIGDKAFYGCTALADVECHPDAAGLAWGDASEDFKADGSTEIHVKASQLAAYKAKFGATVRATFVGDLDVPPEVATTIAAIDAIGEVAYTDESKAKIDAARAAYDALTDAQKALVANYAILTAAETTYASLKAAADAAAAAAVSAAIDAIGEVAYTDESKGKIDAARAAYDALTNEQKALVPNYATLTAAEAAYAALVPPPVAPAPCYAVINEADIVSPFAAEKAVTLMGAAYDGCDVAGIVELKLGKVNAQKGTGKVSGSVTTLDGKKHAAKAVGVTGIAGTGPKTVSLEVKGLGTMTVTIGGNQFAGALGGTYHVQSADVGGAWAGGSAVAALEPGDLSVFAGTVLSDFLPTNEVAAVSGGKWKFAKAASVKWAKPKKGAPPPEIYDEASGKGLVVETAKGTNLSGLKLAYTPKKGTFKGSFNVYALEGEGKATKLKKYKLSVSGVVVGGVGYGKATAKKPAVSWPMTVQ